LIVVDDHRKKIKIAILERTAGKNHQRPSFLVFKSPERESYHVESLDDIDKEAWNNLIVLVVPCWIRPRQTSDAPRANIVQSLRKEKIRISR
jgi:hypothetical protein